MSKPPQKRVNTSLLYRARDDPVKDGLANSRAIYKSPDPRILLFRLLVVSSSRLASLRRAARGVMRGGGASRRRRALPLWRGACDEQSERKESDLSIALGEQLDRLLDCKNSPW